MNAVTRVDPLALAHTLGVELAKTEAAAAASSRGSAATAEPIDLELHPRVRAALDKNTGDRSKDTMRIVGACYDDRLTLEQARYVIGERPDLVERLTERDNDDDVLTCWIKAVNSRQDAHRAKTTPGGKPRNVASALDVFRYWLHMGDTAPVLALAATVVANLADGDPVWFLLIGPPSGGKTEILSAVTSLEYIVPAATITEAALLSGTSRKERAKDATGGLLRQIGDFGILLAKDFTSVLSQNKDTAKAAMAALRECYDGSWDRPVGTDGGRVLHWAGKCGFLGGATPSYDRYGAVVNALGDRYLLLRLPDVDAGKQARAALKAAQHETEMRAEIADAMLGLIAGADLNQVHAELDADDEDRLIALATFTATARTAVERDGYTGELLVIPQPEGPARLVKALRQLHGALAALGIDYDTRWGVLCRIARDCAPAVRTALIMALLADTGWRRTSDIAEAAELATKTAARHLDDLVLLGIAERTKRKQQQGDDATPPDNSPYYWRAADWLKEHWPKVGQRNTTKREEELKKAAPEPLASSPFGISLSYSCSVCGQDMLSPASIERGMCERCWLTTKRKGA